VVRERQTAERQTAERQRRRDRQRQAETDTQREYLEVRTAEAIVRLVPDRANKV
jgi:hypothetical protein